MELMNRIIKRPVLVLPRTAQPRTESRVRVGVWLELLTLFTGLLGYVFCNTTALDMGISPVFLVGMTAVSFALMILLCWYKRVFFGVLGGTALLGLMAFPLTKQLLLSWGRSIAVCYNYTIYLLASQENYSSYTNFMTMDVDLIAQHPAVLRQYFYTALIVVTLLASLFFALAFFKRIPVMLAFLLPIGGLVPYFFYGIVPHFIAFSVFLSALVGCYGQSVVQFMTRQRQRRARRAEKRRTPKVKGRFKKKKDEPRRVKAKTDRLAFAAAQGSFGLTVTAIMLLVTMAGAAFIYTRPILQMDQVRATIDEMAVQSLNTVFRSTYEKRLNVAGYIEEGETLGMAMPSWRGLQVANVTSRTSNPIYLRYRTTIDLTEDGWTMADPEFLEDYLDRVGSDFCEYTQFYNYLKLTAPSGDPLTAGLDNVDSEEEGYISERLTVYPKYKVSDLLGLAPGETSIVPVSEYLDLEREGDTVLHHNDNPRDRSYMYVLTTPVLTSNVFLTNFEEAQQAYRGIRIQHGDSDPYMSREIIYSQFVYRHYTALPEKIKPILGNLARELTEKYPTRLEKVQAIERYFRENYKYAAVRQRLSREDGSEADAIDYIQYFLHQNENKEGYCTLFASSMVALLRDLGYPARVATGYYVQPAFVDVENSVASLTDRNYHAWVEVYFDGAGWLNFEPTPDFGVGPNYYLLNLIDEGKENEIEVNVEVVYEEDPDFVKYTNELPEPTEKKEEPQNPLTTVLRLNSMSGWARMALYIVLVMLLLLLILFAGEFWRKRSLRRAHTAPPTEGVRHAYYLILRLMQLQGFKFFEGELLADFARRADNLQMAELPLSDIVPVLEKALYSPQPVTEEERETVLSYLHALDRAVFRRANPFRAFFYKLTLSRKPKYKALIWHFT